MVECGWMDGWMDMWADGLNGWMDELIMDESVDRQVGGGKQGWCVALKQLQTTSTSLFCFILITLFCRQGQKHESHSIEVSTEAQKSKVTCSMSHREEATETHITFYSWYLLQ